MRHKIILILICCMSIFFNGCSDNEAPTESEKSTQETSFAETDGKATNNIRYSLVESTEMPEKEDVNFKSYSILQSTLQDILKKTN